MDRAVEHLGPERAGRYLRKFYPWYVDRLGLDPRGQALHNALQATDSVDEARAVRGAASEPSPSRPSAVLTRRYTAPSLARGQHRSRRFRRVFIGPCRGAFSDRERDPCRRTSSSPPKVSRSSRTSSRSSRPCGAARSPSASRRRASSATSPRTPSTTTPRTSRRCSRRASSRSRRSIRSRPGRRRRGRLHRRRRGRHRSSTSRTTTASRSKFTIVGSAEANPPEKLSNESPVGKALHRPQARRRGHGRQLPSGKTRKLKITKIDVGLLAPLAVSDERSHQPSRPRPARRPPREARAAARGRHRPVPARLRGRRADRRRARRARRPRGRRGDRRHATASPAACTPAAARARWRSSTSTTAPAACSCRPSSTCSARRSWSGCWSSTSATWSASTAPIFCSRRGELTLRVEAVHGAREVAAPAAGQAPRPAGRRDALPPPRARPDRQRGVARALHRARQGRSPRSAATSTTRASSRSRRRSCSRSTAARWPGRSRRTTTRWTATSTCGSPPSCTSSA